VGDSKEEKEEEEGKGERGRTEDWRRGNLLKDAADEAEIAKRIQDDLV
jgi:hypothetical protein